MATHKFFVSLSLPLRSHPIYVTHEVGECEMNNPSTPLTRGIPSRWLFSKPGEEAVGSGKPYKGGAWSPHCLLKKASRVLYQEV